MCWGINKIKDQDLSLKNIFCARVNSRAWKVLKSVWQMTTLMDRCAQTLARVSIFSIISIFNIFRSTQGSPGFLGSIWSLAWGSLQFLGPGKDLWDFWVRAWISRIFSFKQRSLGMPFLVVQKGYSLYLNSHNAPKAPKIC